LDSSIELDAPKHIFLMVFMLLDRKNPSSFFTPYYDILPPTLNNMPIFWTASELRGLEGSYLLEQIEERNTAIAADYSAICKVVPQFPLVATLEEFKWARMCVCSRNFGLIVNGIRTAALVPYADMLNHYRPRETKWQYEDSSQTFTIVSLQGIGAGAQVYDSYGQKCNHRFLLNYGFSVENNVEPDGFCPNEVTSNQPISPHLTSPLVAAGVCLFSSPSCLPK
jgi:protein-histidine N-methyltransferase